MVRCLYISNAVEYKLGILWKTPKNLLDFKDKFLFRGLQYEKVSSFDRLGLLYIYPKE